jgi:hypothetical protein
VTRVAAWLLMLGAALAQGGGGVRVLDRGDQSNIDDRRRVVVRTQEEWNTLWREHAPDRPQPAVDLAADLVLGVFMGSRPTAGFSVEVASALVEGDVLVVNYREHSPGRDVIAAQVLTSPYVIVAFPRHAGEVRFERVP